MSARECYEQLIERMRQNFGVSIANIMFLMKSLRKVFRKTASHSQTSADYNSYLLNVMRFNARLLLILIQTAPCHTLLKANR